MAFASSIGGLFSVREVEISSGHEAEVQPVGVVVTDAAICVLDEKGKVLAPCDADVEGHCRIAATNDRAHEERPPPVHNPEDHRTLLPDLIINAALPDEATVPTVQVELDS